MEGVHLTNLSMPLYTTHYYLVLRLFDDITKKDPANTIGLCRIELFPDWNTLDKLDQGTGEEIINNLYTKGIFYNWKPILLKAKLGAVSTDLSNHMRPWLFENIKSDNLGQLLSNDTLYVPKSLLIQFKIFTGKEKPKKDNVFSFYHYKYKICDDSELYSIFETEKRGRLLFEFVKSCSDKFISVYDMQEKTTIYKRYSSSYNLQSTDVDIIKGRK